jgi:hypothetical protein
MTFPDDLRRTFDLWASTDLKVQLILFYHNNPGLVETVEGLARRMGVTTDALRAPIQDQVRLGVLRERSAGGQTILVYDAAQASRLQANIEELFRAREATV